MQTVSLGLEQQAKIVHQARQARTAARQLANTSSAAKNRALQLMAAKLLVHQDAIIQANKEDVERAQAKGISASLLDRLTLTPARLNTIANSILSVTELDDPTGNVLERWQLQNGLWMEKRSVPLGVIVMIYEARPNVTVDAATLCLKTGNAVLLRGSADAISSNQALTLALREGVREAGLPEDAIQLVEILEHSAVDFLVSQKDLIDLVIPRGGAGLIRSVVEKSTVPVIETGVGNCHVYVDAEADLAMAETIVINAKTQRPSVCNAAESLLVHEDIAEHWLPGLIAELQGRGVEIRGCERTLALVAGLPLASEEDWGREFLDLILAVKIVRNLDEAIEHITEYGTRHSESIVTENKEHAERFLAQVDAAALYHNASTRLTDGFVFGFGAEIGISTQKLHARGPMGLQALTSYKYVGYGTGQIIQ